MEYVSNVTAYSIRVESRYRNKRLPWALDAIFILNGYLVRNQRDGLKRAQKHFSKNPSKFQFQPHEYKVSAQIIRIQH